MTPHHYRVAKVVREIIILLPILGECWLRTIPKALPWADLFLAFQAVFPRMYCLGTLSFCPSVRNKGVGFYLPSLGEGSGVGLLSFCLI